MKSSGQGAEGIMGTSSATRDLVSIIRVPNAAVVMTLLGQMVPSGTGADQPSNRFIRRFSRAMGFRIAASAASRSATVSGSSSGGAAAGAGLPIS